MAKENKVQIFINDKEMLYSHQNLIAAVHSFIPYLTNDDLKTLEQDIHTVLDHRQQEEHLAKLAAKDIPIQSNRHDTP